MAPYVRVKSSAFCISKQGNQKEKSERERDGDDGKEWKMEGILTTRSMLAKTASPDLGARGAMLYSKNRVILLRKQ